MPGSLRARVEEAVRDYASPPAGEAIPQALHQIARALIAEAKAASHDSRDTAMTVLAADAFVTWACEAVAEMDPGRLGELR